MHLCWPYFCVLRSMSLTSGLQRLCCLKNLYMIQQRSFNGNTNFPQRSVKFMVNCRLLRRNMDMWVTSGLRFSRNRSINVAAEHTADSSCLISSEQPGPGSILASTPDNQLPCDLDAAPHPSPFVDICEDGAVQIRVPNALPPASSSLRSYVDKSDTLTKLVQLGVSLWKLEQRPNVGSMLLSLDFEEDVTPRLLFLKEIGLQDTQLGPLLTQNPFILKENLENLEARVSYLKSKKFSPEAIISMVSKAPYLLNFSVKRLDNRLLFFQQRLGLSAKTTRDLVTRLPKLLSGSLEPIKENLKVCELEFGFRENEIQQIITKVPKVFIISKVKLIQIFDFIHNVMDVPHSHLAKFPQVFNAKLLRIKARHLFLVHLGRAQYDPAQPKYISLDRLVCLPDEAFCSELASTPLEDFELFQKTM